MVIVLSPLAADQYSPFQHFFFFFFPRRGRGNGKSLSLFVCAVHKEEQTACNTKSSNVQTDGRHAQKHRNHYFSNRGCQ